MIEMSRLLFALWVVLCFVPDYYPTIAESEPYSFLEQYDFDNKTSSASHEANGLVVWVEIVAPRRKRRPYRNPLRKLRKQLRGLRRKRRRLLKKRYSRVSPTKGKLSVEPRPDSIADAVQDAQEIPARNNRLGRPATIETNHVFCPNENCRGFQVIGPDLNHWIVGHGTYTTQGGGKRQMFLCKLCNTPFSETRGTLFYGSSLAAPCRAT